MGSGDAPYLPGMSVDDPGAEARRRFELALARLQAPAGEDAETIARLAEAGDAHAQFLHGRSRQIQYDDPYRGLGWLERAAVQGHGEAAKALAEFHRAQLPDDAPGPEAVESGRVVADAVRHWYARAADAGQPVPEADRQVPAWALGTNAPVDGTWTAVRRRLEELAARGHADAAHRIGMSLWCSGARESPEPWLRRAAEGGDREAMHSLGLWHLEQFDDGHFHEIVDPATLAQPLSTDDQARLEWQAGLGEAERAHLVEQRAVRTEAIRWLAAAGERGDVEAAVTLAAFLERSGPAFASLAARWMERAASLGDTSSIASYARMLEEGRGVAADAAGAHAWYARAAAAFEEASRHDDGFAPFALCQLAELHLRGRGLPRDAGRAVTLYEQAAAKGHHWAMLSLGDLYERGDGVGRDLGRAEAWYVRAMEAGDAGFARVRLDDLRATARHEAETVALSGVRVSRELVERAEAGDTRAMLAVSDCLDTEGEAAAARTWLERAAESGDAVAAFRMFLDTMGADGIGETARTWRRRAAAAGHVSALQMIGDELLDPDSTGPLDFPLGYAWLVIASRERHAQPASAAALQRAQAAARAADVWETLSAEERARALAIIAKCDVGPPHRLPDELGDQGATGFGSPSRSA